MLALTNLSKELDLEKNLAFTCNEFNEANLDIEEKKILVESLSSAFDLSIFSPLSIVLPEGEEVLSKNFHRNHSFNQRLDILVKVLNEISDQHSQLSTDVRYFLLYYKMLQGKIKFVESQSHMADGLTRYPYLERYIGSRNEDYSPSDSINGGGFIDV